MEMRACYSTHVSVHLCTLYICTTRSCNARLVRFGVLVFHMYTRMPACMFCMFYTAFAIYVFRL